MARAKKAAEQEGTSRFSEIQMKVFLDRYALKGKDLVPGGPALVVDKGDPRRGQVVTVVDQEGYRVRARLADGTVGEFQRGAIVPLLETDPTQMWDRVARAIAAVEGTEEKRAYWEERFRWAMDGFKFVPGGRILAGAGSGKDVTYYNCFVIPLVEDSRKGIVKTLENMIEIMARGGGVGINGSTLRPRGAYVRGVNGTSSGAVSWMEIFSDATGLIEQGGSRRGALMLMLAAWHPDIETFITVKRDFSRFNNANLSVIIPDDFMEAVEEDADWDLVFPDTDVPEYKQLWDGDLVAWRAAGKPVRVYKTVKARKLWDLIIESNWASGEPGVVFLERYNKLSNTWYFQKLISVNPCGEQGLPAWGVCNLGSLGLSAFVRDGEVDWATLTETTRVAVRFLDDVIDETRYIFEENRQSQMAARRVGLGTQGLAHMLIKLKLRYGSPEGNAFIAELYRRIMLDAYWASVEIAREKGPFQAFDRDKFLQGEFIKRLPEDLRDAIAQYGIRNATLLTQAPTGTTSLLAGMSSGIEPVFRFKMKRVDRIGEHYIYDPLYQEWERAHPGAERPDYFVEADELTPEEHVEVQAIIQRFVDSSISKTVNAPNHHTVEDTRRVYELAYRLGCKGITYFRDGSRSGVLSEIKEEKKAEKAAPTAAGVQEAAAGAQARQIPLIPQVGGPRDLAAATGVNGAWGSIRPIDRPLRLEGFTDVKETPLGKLFLTLNLLDGHPVELFAQIGKAGSDVAAFTEAMARLVSLALRCGVAPEEVADQLLGIGGSRSVGFGSQRVRSVPDAIGQFLSDYLHRWRGGGEEATAAEGERGAAGPGQAHGHKGQLAFNLNGNGEAKNMSLCPSCGMHSLAPVEGCATCLNCGYSEC